MQLQLKSLITTSHHHFSFADLLLQELNSFRRVAGLTEYEQLRLILILLFLFGRAQPVVSGRFTRSLLVNFRTARARLLRRDRCSCIDGLVPLNHQILIL